MLMSAFDEIQVLLSEKADLNARLSLIPYEGTPEIKDVKEKKYLYTRKRVGSRVTSTYVGVYSDELHQLLLRNTRDARELRRQIRKLDKRLAELGYQEGELSARVIENLNFARANMKANIYDQAVLEGVATSFPQTEEIIENGKVNGMTASDVQKILNLKHAWEFILDQDVIQAKSDYYVLCHIARLVNEGFFPDGGRIRGVPVTIGSSSYIPPLPIESVVKEHIEDILQANIDDIDKSIRLCLYTMKTQVFIDGNKRAAIIYANHYLIAHGQGFLVIPEAHVSGFKKLLVEYYEGEDPNRITDFLKTNCWKTF
ncbi:MAG: Fic family protein [Saccharofermentanales bacterium]|jgi:prophage maintenance system killer protein|nr:Fic family protein [Bacillota bacterium]